MSRRPVPLHERKTFRPRDCEVNYPHSVYRIYDEDDVLMYVGVARDVTHRVYMHEAAAQSSWASTQMVGCIARWTTEEHPTKAAAREAERRAIETEAPLYNRQHNPKRWRRVAGQWQQTNLLADSA